MNDLMNNNDLTEKEICTFFGPNADYYLKRWRLTVDGSGGVTGLNWAALLLAGLWLPYRKMYRIASIFLGVILLEIVLEEVVYVGILGRPEAPAVFGLIAGLVASFICGGLANEWYLSHARKTIAKVRSQGLPEEAYFGALAKQGGTSLAAALGCFAIFLLASIAALLLLELFLNRT